MTKRFRMLRFVSLLYKVIAWIALLMAVLAAILVVVVGAIQGRAGAPSPLLAPVPGLNRASGLFSGLLVGGLVLLVGLLQFVFIFAVGEAIQLALAIEDNTRKSAYYLSGEGAIPAPPAGGSWEESSGSGTEL
ncbi:MAG: hypothetical protein H5T69_14235 [Chloroflexi bacterium]|nr:hypothetical protein [Chloroflexota bacterium]